MCPSYETLLFDVEAPVLQLWGMSLLQGLFWPRMVVTVISLSMAQIEYLTIYYTWKYLTVRKELVDIKVNY